MRIAWFSPFPPSTSGIAAYSAELVPRLRAQHAIDPYVDQDDVVFPGAIHARDFVWRQRRSPYDLVVYQLGNARCHHYMWGYLFRYPGVVVLHDAQLHQARALGLLTERVWPRRDDYMVEFRATHPEASPQTAELIAAGLGGTLYSHWPFLRLVLAAARLVVVHNARVRDHLRETYPGAAIEALEMGVRDPQETFTVHRPRLKDRDQRAVRQRRGIPTDALVVAAFGAVTPEKRLDAVIRAMAALSTEVPSLHLVLVGAAVEHYDIVRVIQDAGFDPSRVSITGFVDDEALDDCLMAADICACLRWPTNRETSASWLRCLAAGKPTIITALSHLSDLPTVNATSWTMAMPGDERRPMAVSVDVLEEDRGVRAALQTLAADAAQREAIGGAAREWFLAHHRLDDMAEAYGHLLVTAHQRPMPRPDLPYHLLADGSATLRTLIDELEVHHRVSDLL